MKFEEKCARSLDLESSKICFYRKKNNQYVHRKCIIITKINCPKYLIKKIKKK